MKFGEELFPKGTFPSQQTDGLYIDETKAKNLDIIAESMHKDLAITAIYSGNDQSGTGKTTVITQDACYLTWKINQVYKLNNTFTSRNIFFKIDNLIKAAPIIAKEQPYSVLVLDESDKLTQNQVRTEAYALKNVVRKLRQLNVILLLTSHGFFELPKFYALNRAQYLVNVRFEGKFDRGFFRFYGPKAKKLLYLRGKKEWDYDCYKFDFEGRFGSNYAFFPNCKEETEKYKASKYKDMIDDIEGNENKVKPLTEKQIKAKLFKQLHTNLTELSVKRLAEGFGISKRTGFAWLKDINDEDNDTTEEECENAKHYINNIDKNENILDREEDEDKEDESNNSS